MSQRATEKERPVQVEKFIQTVEDYNELDSFLTEISSSYSVTSKKLHSTTNTRTNSRVIRGNVDQGGDHHDSAIVSGAHSLAEEPSCHFRKNSRNKSKTSTLQVQTCEHDNAQEQLCSSGGDTQQLLTAARLEVDVGSVISSCASSQLSLTVSELEDDCVPCDDELSRAALNDWVGCVCENGRTGPIPLKGRVGTSGNEVACYNTPGSLVPVDQNNGEICLIPSKPEPVRPIPLKAPPTTGNEVVRYNSPGGLVPVVQNNREICLITSTPKPANTLNDNLALVDPTQIGGVTITEITSITEVSPSSKALIVATVDLSRKPVGPFGVVVEATEIGKEKKTKKTAVPKGQSESDLVPKRADKISRVHNARLTSSTTKVEGKIRVQNQLDLGLIQRESRTALEESLSYVLKPGIKGLKEFLSNRHMGIGDDKQPQLANFIDYFIDCDGLRYLGILEQIELDFEDRCKAALLHSHVNNDKRAVQLRIKLAKIAEIQAVYQQRELKDFDFPELLQAQLRAFPINSQPKISAIQKIHQYGLEMENYWYDKMKQEKQVDPVEVYDIATQILAEVMSQLFSILVKLCEFLIYVNQEPRKFKNKFTAENLITFFTDFRMLTVDEVAAVGETIGGVVMRIPQLKKEYGYEIMTKLYSQINFVDICTCRALRAVIPLILHYDVNKNRKN